MALQREGKINLFPPQIIILSALNKNRQFKEFLESKKFPEESVEPFMIDFDFKNKVWKLFGDH